MASSTRLRRPSFTRTEEPRACPGSPAPEQNLVPVLAYALPDDLPVGLAGLTDLHPDTFEPQYVYAFLSAASQRESERGFTGTLIHEIGHFLGLSHTSDGYDPESGVHYQPTGRYAPAPGISPHTATPGRSARPRPPTPSWRAQPGGRLPGICDIRTDAAGSAWS